MMAIVFGIFISSLYDDADDFDDDNDVEHDDDVEIHLWIMDDYTLHHNNDNDESYNLLFFQGCWAFRWGPVYVSGIIKAFI